MRDLMRGENIVKDIKGTKNQMSLGVGVGGEHLNRMEDMKLVKKITDWSPTGLRTKGRQKNRWGDETVNDLKKLNLRIWSQIVKDRKAWNDLMQKTISCEGL